MSPSHGNVQWLFCTDNTSLSSRDYVQTSGAVGDLRGHPAGSSPPLSLVSLQNGPAQSRQIGTFSASQLASAGGSDCSQEYQALVGRAGAQSRPGCCHPALPLVPFSVLRLTGAGSPTTLRPFPGPNEATAMYGALGIIRSLS